MGRSEESPGNRLTIPAQSWFPTLADNERVLPLVSVERRPDLSLFNPIIVQAWSGRSKQPVLSKNRPRMVEVQRFQRNLARGLATVATWWHTACKFRPVVGITQ
jgi:hypothetical protein